MSEPLASWLLLAGRAAIAAVFLVSGVHKLIWYRKAIAEFEQEGIPLIPATLPATILLHLVAPACLVTGFFVTEAALALAAFTVIVTVKVHCFWAMQGEQRLIISRIAMANLAIVGGLLVVAAIGA